MRLSKITKEQLKDVAIRTAKTFVVAGLAAVPALGTTDIKSWLITFGSAGLTAVLNLIIKIFEESEE